jgi:hypothetical protein
MESGMRKAADGNCQNYRSWNQSGYEKWGRESLVVRTRRIG